MKKICSLIVLSVIFQLSAFAQYNKGSIFIDGTLNYNNDNSKFINSNFSTNSGAFSISPGIGYFLMNNLVIGVGVDSQSFNNSSSTTTTDISTDINGVVSTSSIISATSIKWTEMSPAVFVKYFMPVSDKLSFDVNARYSHGLLKDQSTITQDTISSGTPAGHSILTGDKPATQSSRLNISLGMHYLVTNKFGLEVNFGGFSYSSTPVIHTYDNVTYNSSITWGTKTTSSFNVNPAAWSFGVFIILGGQK